MEKMPNVSRMLFARVSGRPLFDLYLRAGLRASHQLRPVVHERRQVLFNCPLSVRAPPRLCTLLQASVST